MYVCYTDFPRLVTDSPVGLAAICYHLFESQSCTATVYKLFFFYFLCGWSFLDRGRENRALFGFINFKTPLDFNPKGTRKKKGLDLFYGPHIFYVYTWRASSSPEVGPTVAVVSVTTVSLVGGLWL